MNESDKTFLSQAIDLSKQALENNSGGPFGAVIVKDNQVIGVGCNMVTSALDPTAHAEIVAIRAACKQLQSFQLTDCTIYTSCEPCPMCLGAIYWARPARLVYACTREDAASVGFDDDFIYKELDLQPGFRKITTDNFMREEGLEVMKLWLEKQDRVDY